MGTHQERTIGAAIAPIFADDNGGGLCCTLETVNADGMDVSIQVMQDSINIAPYPHRQEPLTCMELSCVLHRLDDPVREVVNREANDFDAREVAELVDITFVKLPSCDDASYAISATTEDPG